MDRLDFLNKARSYAQQQCCDSSCLSDEEWKEIKKRMKKTSTEIELYRKAKSILKDAALDMEIPDKDKD